MSITMYSVFMAILWFSVFTVIFSLLMRHNWFVGAFNIWTLVILVALCILRAVMPIELPGAIVLRSYTLFGIVRDALNYGLFTVAGFNVTVLTVLLIIWGIVSLFFIVRLVMHYVRFHIKARKLPFSNDERLARIVKEVCPTGKNIKIIKAQDIAVPMVAGLTYPVIFFPEISLSDEAIQNIILHEWNHYLHKDTWIKMFVKIICYLMWWNPLAYLLELNLDHILEMKCDRDVLAVLPEDKHSTYFAIIYDVYCKTHKGSTSQPSPYCSNLYASRREKQLIQRFSLGMNPIRIKHQKLAYAALITAVVILFTVSYLFIIQPASFPDPEPGVYVSTEENSYVVDHGDGTYSFYIDGMYFCDIPSIDVEPYVNYEIRKE